MNSTYAQKSSPVQNVPGSTTASVIDSSAQSESLQRKADMANDAAQRAGAPRPNNTGMPDNLKAGIESLSGFSMDNVRVHYNSSKPATVQALAYTQGADIHVAPGQEKHLPHEAWHVAQQMAGRVSPTTNINGMPVNDNAALEHESDVMGEKAVQCKRGVVYSRITQCSATPIQFYKKKGEFVVSETDKYAVKENEASTVYIRSDIESSDVNEAKTNLGNIGISETEGTLSLADITYKVFKRQYRENSFNETLKYKGTPSFDSKDNLNSQLFIVNNLISICNALIENKPQQIDNTSWLNSLKTADFISLGSDVENDWRLIKKMLGTKEKKNDDLLLLGFVLNDLNFRKSQIENEKIIKKDPSKCPDQAGLTTECGALASQLSPIFSKSKLGLTITDGEEFYDQSLFVGFWANHFSTKIANDENDILCIEDAVGKSNGRTHLAHAHWFARIYGNEAPPLQQEENGEFILNISKPSNIDFKSNKKWTFTGSDLLENIGLEVTYNSTKNCFYGKFTGDERYLDPYKKDFLLQTAYSHLKKFFIKKYIDDAQLRESSISCVIL